MGGDGTHDVTRDRLVRLGWSGTDHVGWPAPDADDGPAAPDRRENPELGERPATVLRLVRDDVSAGAGTEQASDLGALRERALAAAVRGYTATHGHPLDHAASTKRPIARWAVSTRVAVAAVVALAIPVAVVAVRSWQAEPVTVLATSETGGRATAGATGTGPVGPGRPDEAATPAEGPAGAPAGSVNPGTPAGAPGSVPAAAPGAVEVVVHVVGQVARPGLVVLAGGSRVADAVTAAGGATDEADLAALNLARVLVDGEQIVVPRPGEVPPNPGVSATAGPPGATVPGSAGTLDLNSAQVGDLDGLPGIGPVLAQRIVDWRTEHGRFSTVDELAEVRGIGPSLMADLRAAVHV